MCFLSSARRSGTVPGSRVYFLFSPRHTGHWVMVKSMARLPKRWLHLREYMQPLTTLSFFSSDSCKAVEIWIAVTRGGFDPYAFQTRYSKCQWYPSRQRRGDTDWCRAWLFWLLWVWHLLLTSAGRLKEILIDCSLLLVVLNSAPLKIAVLMVNYDSRSAEMGIDWRHT